MNSFTMTINVWTPEDRATRDDMIDYCVDNRIECLEEQIDEKKRRFTFNKLANITDDSKWRLLLAYTTFQYEMMKYSGAHA